MFYVGNERKASQILAEQKKNINKNEKSEIITKLVKLAKFMKESLQIGNLNDFGEILHQGWVLKKKMARNISNQVLDEYYEKALKAGVIGGKLLGAGGGGFFLFYCKQRYQEDVRKALNLKELNFKFDNEGSKIIYIGQ